MLQLLLFAALLLLPFSATPFFMVWCYQKLLHLSESAFLIIEAVEIVVVVMYISQSFVNEIDEQPVIVKVGNKLFLFSSMFCLEIQENVSF